ncbi:MAG TPA: NAD-dependent epimerase/dehydratase family protein [Burkholderiales bacterium]|nr:NAD-dependent epimerase/dehydratase family protein [Burkholderiales bacterium]
MKALVIGGTGPSGPYIVNGLLERGYDVTILHGGQHEVEFVQPVEHIHTDPHFAETLGPALEGRSFDIAIATYGRMRIIADLLRGKTVRFIGAGGSSVYAHHQDARWGPLGPPTMLSEDGPRCDDPSGPKFNHLMWVTEETVMRAHREGHYSATYFRYPLLYGPHSPANPDWSIVRRILDGRKRLVIPHNGELKRRGYARNVAHALLLAVDQPAESAGQFYNIRDEHQFTQRQYVSFIARHLRHECEIVEVPPPLAQRVYKGGTSRPRDWTIEYDIAKIRIQLGYRDVISPAQALADSVDWLVANRSEPGGEIERQLGDPFAYAAEDAMLKAYNAGYEAANAVQFPDTQLGHMYRHPKKPGEAWAPPVRS